jgi:hypothetical protein
MTRQIKNLPASIHFQLNQLAKAQRRSFMDVFYYYANERFLYRLSHSKNAKNFVLKGGLVFVGQGILLRRPTRDIDMQGFIVNSIENLVEIVKDVCLQPVEPDGMLFDPESITGEQIMDEADYHGVRVRFNGYLGQSQIFLQVDISFANEITPADISVKYPLLLGGAPFELRGYPFETMIAEKFQAMVALGTYNDRLKDFYDIWFLAQQIRFEGKILVRALMATFLSRNTPLPNELPVALSDSFAIQKQHQWQVFLNKFIEPSLELADFGQVLAVLRQFLMPPLGAANTGTSFDFTWKPGGPWESS